jgi:hypothetical protein
MWLRVTLASLLAAILLPVSCVAAACELSCDFNDLAQTCHPGGSNQGHAHPGVHSPMTGMQPSMQHGATGQLSRSSEAALAVVESLSDCDHHACGEQSALLSHENRTAIHPDPVTVVIAILPQRLARIPTPLGHCGVRSSFFSYIDSLQTYKKFW